MVADNRLIVKNTLLLYIRMFVMMITSLFTSRIVLHILGETDFGIYNIIGGVVVLFSFLNSALLSATQRFLNYNLGKNDLDSTHRVFCMSVNSYFILSLIVFLLGETVGLWFVNAQLNIPDVRMNAANWVYQFTLITFIINLLRVPYNATIIAYERMNFYAYLSLGEVALKLVVVYLLYLTTFDKLVIYALLYMLVPLFITFLYKVYSNRHFDITHYEWIWDKNMFKELFSFSGWSLFGSLANLSASQGLNILVNIFHGVTLNTALGIANQLVSGVTGFISNFQVAFNPQIVKNYAAKEYTSLYNLIFSSSKFSYFLLLFIALPIILNINPILSIWLVDVPKYTGIFSQLILVFFLIEAISAPLWMFVQATGKIRNYQILMAILIFMNFPMMYLVLKMNLPVYYVWIVRIFVQMLVFCARCIYIKKVYDFPLINYCLNVLLPVILVSVFAIPLSLLIKIFLPGYWLNFIMSMLISMLITVILVIILGLNKREKSLLKKYIPTNLLICNSKCKIKK